MMLPTFIVQATFIDYLFHTTVIVSCTGPGLFIIVVLFTCTDAGLVVFVVVVDEQTLATIAITKIRVIKSTFLSLSPNFING
jgi:hypothetical protein